MATAGPSGLQNFAPSGVRDPDDMPKRVPPSITEPDGHLKTPEQVLAEPNGAANIDNYYRSLYIYLSNPEGYGLTQYLDQFGDQYDNAAGSQ